MRTLKTSVVLVVLGFVFGFGCALQPPSGDGGLGIGEACTDSAECDEASGLFCSSKGFCSDGSEPQPCGEEGDCDSESGFFCSAAEQCSNGSEGDPCVSSEDCNEADGLFCIDSDNSGVGVCTNGSNGDDCLTGDDCQSGFCDQDSLTCAEPPAVDDCRVQDDCAVGTFCNQANGICTGGGCLNDGDCASGTCVGEVGFTPGTCQNPVNDCRTVDNCAIDTFCNQVNGICTGGGCLNNGDCSTGNCSGASGSTPGICQPPVSDCRTVDTCTVGQFCNQSNGICTNGGCLNDGDCASGTTCVGESGSTPGICQAPVSDCRVVDTCNVGQFCNQSNGICTNGGCLNDGDCSSGDICSGENGNTPGVCIDDPANGTPCSSGQCPDGLVCQSNVCVVTNGDECSLCDGQGDCDNAPVDLQCQTGTCVNPNNSGFCSAGCTDSSECDQANGFFCSSVGQCSNGGEGEACSVNDDCDPTQGLVCDGSVCGQPGGGGIDCSYDHINATPGQLCFGAGGFRGNDAPNHIVKLVGYNGFLGRGQESPGEPYNPNNGFAESQGLNLTYNATIDSWCTAANAIPVNNTGTGQIILMTPKDLSVPFLQSFWQGDADCLSSADEDQASYDFTLVNNVNNQCVNSAVYEIFTTSGTTATPVSTISAGAPTASFIALWPAGSNLLITNIGDGAVQQSLGCF